MNEYSERAYLYIAGRPEGPIKVGISRKPINRLSMLGTGCPFQIELLHLKIMDNMETARENETEFMIVNQHKRMSGEWFDMDIYEVLEYFETTVEIQNYYLDKFSREQEKENAPKRYIAAWEALAIS